MVALRTVGGMLAAAASRGETSGPSWRPRWRLVVVVLEEGRGVLLRRHVYGVTVPPGGGPDPAQPVE